MAMLLGSLISGIIGIIGTAGTLTFLGKRRSGHATDSAWFLGLGALVVAWLLALLGLLGQVPKDIIDTPLPPSVLFSSALALLGVIVTDAINRRLPGWGSPVSPKVSWLLGASALAPAWIVALWFLQ